MPRAPGQFTHRAIPWLVAKMRGGVYRASFLAVVGLHDNGHKSVHIASVANGLILFLSRPSWTAHSDEHGLINELNADDFRFRSK